MAALEPGTPAPEFTLSSHLGDKVTLSSLRGKPVVITFHVLDFTGSEEAG